MDEPTPPSGKGDGPVEGWVAPQDWVGPSGRRSDTLLIRVAKVIAAVAVVILISAFAFGFVYGFLADPDAPVVLPWEAAPTLTVAAAYTAAAEAYTRDMTQLTDELNSSGDPAVAGRMADRSREWSDTLRALAVPDEAKDELDSLLKAESTDETLLRAMASGRTDEETLRQYYMNDLEATAAANLFRLVLGLPPARPPSVAPLPTQFGNDARVLDHLRTSIPDLVEWGDSFGEPGEGPPVPGFDLGQVDLGKLGIELGWARGVDRNGLSADLTGFMDAYQDLLELGYSNAQSFDARDETDELAGRPMKSEDIAALENLRWVMNLIRDGFAPAVPR